MRNKYKVGLFKLNLFAAAALLALCAATSARALDTTLLGLAALWLGITGIVIEFSHRRHAYRAWLVVASVLLAALVMLSPDANGAWLWAWPFLLILPQPQWMLILNASLAGISWWSLITQMSLHHWGLAGALLLCLCFLAIGRALPGGHSQRLMRRRARLAPGLPLWSASQLERDLARENSRATRDGVHAELVVIQIHGRSLWRVAQAICTRIKRFENAYRLNGRTVAVMLTSRDAVQARQRRQELLEDIAVPITVRTVSIANLDNLPMVLAALDKQCPVTQVVEDDA